MQEKVSIIIPVYNGEKYISRMIDCVENQTYQNLQIIIAYDIKSTDKTLEILKQYQMKSPHEFIIDRGCDSSTGEARNRGYKLATGDFVIFIDADDYIFPTMIEDYLNGVLENGLDVSTGKFAYCDDKNLEELKLKLNETNNKNIKYELYSNIDVLNEFWKPHRHYAIPCWNYLIRKSYLEEHKIRFVNSSRGDDMVFVVQCLKHTPKISVCNHYGYLYIQVPTSIIHTPLKNKDEFLRLSFDKNQECEDCFSTIRLRFYFHTLYVNLRYNVALSYDEFNQNNIKNGIYKLPIFPDLNWKEKLSIIGYNIHPKIFYYGVRCYKSWKK